MEKKMIEEIQKTVTEMTHWREHFWKGKILHKVKICIMQK